LVYPDAIEVFNHLENERLRGVVKLTCAKFEGAMIASFLAAILKMAQSQFRGLLAVLEQQRAGQLGEERQLHIWMFCDGRSCPFWSKMAPRLV
jgi:hypothetical protein